MKRSIFATLLFPLAIAGCAADATSTDADDDSASVAAAPTPAIDEHVDTQAYALTTSSTTALDPSKYCLPGETVKCTLGPPPVCTCVPATKTTLYAW